MGQRELGKGYANFIKEISALILICNVLYPSPPHVVWYNLQVHNICEETCLNCVETISHNYYNLQLLLTKTVVSGHEWQNRHLFLLYLVVKPHFYLWRSSFSNLCLPSHHGLVSCMPLVLQSWGFFLHWPYINY